VDANTPAPLAQQNGFAWATAFESLPQGIAFAVGLPSTVEKEMWVADGTYYPKIKRDPLDTVGVSMSFSLPPNTRLYGGFRGVDGAFPGEQGVNERKAGYFTKTVLNGLVSGQNVRHVVFCEPAVYLLGGGFRERARVDGFRIVGGRAAGPTDEDNRGGGIYAMDTSLIIKNCEFESNVAAQDGGAVYWRNDWNYNSIDIGCNTDTGVEMGFGISESRFRSNIAIDRGGAVYCHLGEKIPFESTIANHVPTSGLPSYVQNCEFVNNQAGLRLDVQSTAYQAGGAVAFFNCADLTINGNVFANNTVHGKGSAVYLDHEWYARPCDGASPVKPHFSSFRNNTFYGNDSLPHNVAGSPPATPFTAAVYSEPRPANADPTHLAPTHVFSNSIVWANVTVTPGGILGTDRMGPVSDFAVHSSDIEYPFSNVWPSAFPSDPNADNINDNPHFENALFGDFRLKDDSSTGGYRSPCIGTGTDILTAGDAGDVNEDGDFGLSNGGEIPFAPSWTNVFFQDPGVGVDRVLGVPVAPQVYAIDMGAMERE
jgi:hypothetical protein